MNRRNLIALFLYILLAVALTYPLITQIADHVPGSATWSLDEYGYVWNNWWFKYAVFDRGLNPFSTNYLFYPLGTSLVLYAYTLLHVLLALPLQFAFGLIPAVNGTVLFSFVVAAFGMYLFVSYLLRVSLRIWNEKYDARLGAVVTDPALQAFAAFAAGLAFGFTSNRFVYVSLGHYNIVASEWLPFYLLFFFKTLLENRIKNAVLAGLFAAFALYTETTDGVLLALLTAVILVFEWRLLNRASLARLALVAATAALVFGPLLLPTLNEIFASGYSLPGWGDSNKLVVDLNGFFTPTSLNPFNRHWEAEIDQVRQGISRFRDINTYFVGYATALLALIGFLLFARRNRLWLAVILVFAVLALGPLLTVNGISEFDLDGLTTTLPLPYLLLHYIPLLKENRVPNRYSILVTVGLAVLIAYAVWWILARIAWRPSRGARPVVAAAVTGLLSAFLLVEHLAVPLPLTDARPPDVYRQIAAEPGDFTVLSLPLGWRNSFGQLGAEDTRTQYYQTVSEKFLLTGQIQRNPPILFDYFQRAPILRDLIALETYNPVDDAAVASDRALAPSFVYFFDIRYLVVNASVPSRPPYSDTRDSVLQFVQQVFPLGDKVYDGGGTVAFKIKQPSEPPQLDIDFGAEGAHLFQGDGWQPDESIGGAMGNWSTRPNAQVFLPIRTLRNYTLTVRALPFDYAGHLQTLTLSVNGRALQTQSLKSSWNEYTFALPRAALHSGLNDLTWQFGYLVSPSVAVPPNFQIGGTGVSSPVDIAVQSNAQFGSIRVAGREVSPLKRGYNLAVIDPRTGTVLDVKNFDTGGQSILESRALREFLTKLPPGVIVAGAVQEDAAAMLGGGAADALKALGLTTDLRGKSGYSHAFIAVKGRPGGLEASGQGPSAVSVGHNPDDRLLGVAFDWLRLVPTP